MDRRDITETGYKPAEDHLKKALGVIIESYKGADPKKLYSEAILCFDALIDISLNTEAIRDFSSRNNMDIKYLVDGANFVISQMHFNPEDNYYITLGVPQDAGPDDIRNRWKRLMLLYHPDRKEGGNEWVSERAKKVNEAYTGLKDNAKRSAFDRKLAEQALRANPVPHYHPRTIPVSKRRRSIIPQENTRWAKTKKYLPKALIVFYLAAAAMFMMFKYHQNDSPSLENEFLPKSVSKPQPSITAVAEELKPSEEENIRGPFTDLDKKSTLGSESKDPLTGPPSSSSGPLETDKGAFQADDPKSTAPPSHDLKERYSSVRPGKEKMHSSKETAQGQTDDPRITSPGAVSMNSSLKREDAQPRPSEQRYASSEQQNIQSYTEKQRTVTQAIVPETKTEPIHNVSSQEITNNEADAFIQKYISAYRENDLKEFMSLFSRSAVENDTEDYNDIQKAYKETFTKKISNYTVKDMNIKIDGRHALVTGFYQVNRYISSENRWVKLSGNIRWKLEKENNIIKIMSINYDK